MVHLQANIGLHFQFDREFFKLQYLVYYAQSALFVSKNGPSRLFRALQSHLEVFDDTSPCSFQKQSVNQLVNHPDPLFGKQVALF